MRRDYRVIGNPLVVIAVTTLCFICLFVLLSQRWMNSLFEKVERQHRQTLVQTVTVARNAVEPILREVREGRMDRAAALDRIRSLVRNMTYEDQDGKNYMFMSSYDGTMLVQPFEPWKEMSNQWDLKDSSGLYIIRELAKAAKREPGGSFVGYYYSLPSVHTTQKKLAYVVGLPELECYLGTGMYMQRSIEEQIDILQKMKFGSIGLTVIVLIPILIAIATIQRRNRQLQDEIAMRRRTERALGANEALLRGLSENLPDVMLYQLNTGSDGSQRVFTYVSPTAEKLHGLHADDVMRNPSLLYDQIDEPYRTALAEAEAEAIARRTQFDMDAPRRLPSGALRWTRITSSPQAQPDGSVLWNGIEIDITERKHLEQQLLQAQKIEAVGQLAGGIAHDFNNLIHAILGYIEIVLLDLGPEDPHYANLKEIERAGERAAALTRQLLAFSRKQVLQLATIDVNQVVAELLYMLERLISENIDLVFRPGEGPANVRADRGQIEQVLTNLCVNARDAMPEGGRLIIEVATVTADESFLLGHEWARRGKYVRIVVEDDGCGMDGDTMRQIFEPFFTTKEKHKGTGLGLAMVYGIIRQHQGMVEVESEVGRGTRFEIHLPAEGATTAAEDVPKERSSPRGGGETILVAEDEEVLRELACTLLTREGYRVISAADGAQALEIYKSRGEEIDLLFLDMIMPKLSGRAVYDAAKASNPAVKCVFSSGYSPAGLHKNFILDDGLHLLQKPYARETLLSCIRKVLDGASLS